jgi:hypothetical protein
MPIIRITKEQLENAAKARKVAVKRNPDFREFVKQDERLKNEAVEAMKSERQP